MCIISPTRCAFPKQSYFAGKEVSGQRRPSIRAFWDHFRLVLHRFVLTIQNHNSLRSTYAGGGECKVLKRETTPLLLKIEIRDTHLTDDNSTLTDKDCRRRKRRLAVWNVSGPIYARQRYIHVYVCVYLSETTFSILSSNI